MRHATLAIALAFWVCTAVAKDGPECMANGLDCFRLYTACHPVGLEVEDLSKDADKLGLSREKLIDAGEARLREAGIYTDEGWPEPYFYIRVTVAGVATSIETRMGKVLNDMTTRRKAYAFTWEEGITGAHQDDGEILGKVHQLLDTFIANFLRVNEPACKQEDAK